MAPFSFIALYRVRPQRVLALQRVRPDTKGLIQQSLTTLFDGILIPNLTAVKRLVNRQ
jgi:hypothetical protein